jgi:hypothetical protein
LKTLTTFDAIHPRRKQRGIVAWPRKKCNIVASSIDFVATPPNCHIVALYPTPFSKITTTSQATH